jgi:hypothetical protein
MTMTVHVAVSRTRGEKDFVAGVFCTLQEGVAALERLHGEPLEVIHNGFAWAVDHRGVEVGYCVETTLGSQLTR